MTKATEKLERWRQDYNQVRPHSALADRSPEEFMRDWKESSAASLRTAWPADETPAGAGHCSDVGDPKPIQPFVPPADVKGRVGKAAHKVTQDRNWKQSSVRSCRLSMLSANKRRQYRHANCVIVTLDGHPFGGESDNNEKETLRSTAYWVWAPFGLGALSSQAWRHRRPVTYLQDVRRSNSQARAQPASEEWIRPLAKTNREEHVRRSALWIDSMRHGVLLGYPIIADAMRGSKFERSQAFRVAAEAGNVKILRRVWNESFLEECEQFGPDEREYAHEDAACGAFNYLAADRYEFSYIPVQWGPATVPERQNALDDARWRRGYRGLV